MNTIITSKEDILKASQKTAYETGLQSINIRNVAADCGVSVGSIYNYFPSKADLIAATIEKVWQEIFHKTRPDQHSLGLIEYVVWLYDTIQIGSEKYPSFFSMHSMSFAVGEKEKGRMVMNDYFSYMKSGLLEALANDASVRTDAFTDEFTQSDFIEFIFSNIISLSVKHSKNCNILTEIIRRTIW